MFTIFCETETPELMEELLKRLVLPEPLTFLLRVPEEMLRVLLLLTLPAIELALAVSEPDAMLIFCAIFMLLSLMVTFPFWILVDPEPEIFLAMLPPVITSPLLTELTTLPCMLAPLAVREPELILIS